MLFRGGRMRGREKGGKEERRRLSPGLVVQVIHCWHEIISEHSTHLLSVVVLPHLSQHAYPIPSPPGLM